MTDPPRSHIELPQVRTHADADGILHVDYAPGADIDLSVAQQVVNAIAAFAEERGRPGPVLIDSSRTRSMSADARRLITSKKVVYSYSAMAVLAGNVVSTLLINIVMRLRKEGSPLKVYTNRREAIEWLKGYL